MALSAPPLPGANSNVTQLPVPPAAENVVEGGEAPKKRGRKPKDPNAAGLPALPLPPKTHEKVSVKMPVSISQGVEYLGGDDYILDLVIRDMTNRGLLVFNPAYTSQAAQ